ncbi:MAG: pimeloyl-[acyl-carrier protein] synthase [Candidatus Azotimanducaceae bacterium]|jgi:pimeloyl-[acyl-carrier protein] synthase
MKPIISKVMSNATQMALWTLRRYDYYINRSLIKLNNPNHYDDPYLTYNTLRDRGTVMRSSANRGWIVTGYNEVTSLLKDQRISSDIRKNAFMVRLLKFASAGIEVPLLDNPTMLNIDPPDHSRLRKLAAKGFVNKYIQSLEPTIESLVDDLLDSIPKDSESFDVMDILAKPLPAIVIAEMMGVPVDDRHLFEDWSEALLGVSEISNPDAIHKAAEANGEMRKYLAELVETKKHTNIQEQNFISMLIATEEDGDKLSLEELYSSCVLLLIAGHETTTRLIGNCLYLLLQNPDQMALAKSNEKLLNNAFEETLRYEPPVQLLVRFINEDMNFQNHKFKKGQMLLITISGANRDPGANDNPNEFDIQRESINHVSFGHGIHLCLGMSLARLEAKVVFKKLFERYPTLECFDKKPTWGTNDFFRGLSTLNVGVTKITK